ncbi:MAG: hypothetical protein RR323_04175 [Raoultibacter sp.]
MNPKFQIEFYNDEAEKEYRKLDGSIKKLVNVGLKKLEERADEIGKELHGPLFGCKELKYLKHGIRVIFRLVDGIVQVVEIIAIGARKDDEVFETAENRLKK